MATKQTDQGAEWFSKRIDWALKQLHHEVGLLRDWFKRDFPESRLEVFVDVDNITHTFIVTTKVLTGIEMTPVNRGHFMNKLVLQEKDLIRPGFMEAFFEQFGTKYREQIASAINAHYNREKSYAT